MIVHLANYKHRAKNRKRCGLELDFEMKNLVNKDLRGFLYC